MKMRFAFLAFVLFLLFSSILSACGNGLAFNEKPTIQFVRDNTELLNRSVDVINSEFAPNEGHSTLVFLDNNQLFMCENSIDQNAPKKEINCPVLTELFESQKIKRIYIRASGDSLQSIEFLVERVGMGSSSYAEIVYIPTDRIEESYFYSDKMQFYAFHDGYMGEIDGSDDYFFYVQISPCWFYIEYGD